MTETDRAPLKGAGRGLDKDCLAAGLADHGGERDSDGRRGRADAHADAGGGSEISGCGAPQRDLEVDGGQGRINRWCGHPNLAGEHALAETHRGGLTGREHGQGTGLRATNNDEPREVGHLGERLARLDHLADKGETSQ